MLCLVRTAFGKASVAPSETPPNALTQGIDMNALLMKATYTIRSVSSRQLLIVGNRGLPDGPVCVYGEPAWDAAVLGTDNHQAEWIIQEYTGPSFPANSGGWLGAPDRPWYQIRNKANGQLLIVGNSGRSGGPVQVIGQREGGWGEAIDNLQKMWRILPWTGPKPETGANANDERPWYRIQNVASGQLLVVANNGQKDGPVVVAGGRDAAGQYTWGTYGEPQTMWLLNIASSVEVVDFQLHEQGFSPAGIQRTQSQTLVNDSSSPQQLTFNFSESATETRSYSWSRSLHIGFKVSKTFKVAKVSETSVEFTFDTTFTVGEENSSSSTWSADYSFPVTVPPRKAMVASLVISEGSFDCPFTMTLRMKGSAETWTETGTFHARRGRGAARVTYTETDLDDPALVRTSAPVEAIPTRVKRAV